MPRHPRRPGALTRFRTPFRADDAVAAGLITHRQLCGPAWRRLFRSVYVDARTPVDHALLVAGAALILPPGAAVAGRSAAVWFGVPWIESGPWTRPRHDPVSSRREERRGKGATPEATAGVEPRRFPVEVVGPRGYGAVAGLEIRTHGLPPDEVTTFRGIRVTTPMRTAWDIARARPVLEAVAWIDALARVRRVGPEAVRRFAAGQPNGPGSRHAREAIAMCDPRAESPPESHLRIHLHQAGIMVVPQYWVVVAGQFVARVDLALPEIRLAIEYDGRWHAASGQLADDRVRLRRLNSVGWTVFSVTHEDLRDVSALIAEVRATIQRLTDRTTS